MSTDDEIFNQLIAESLEHLEEIEPCFLEMEDQGQNVSSETVNQVFRAIHTVKGGASFFGLDNVVDLTHAMESVLMLVRDGKLFVDDNMVDLLLKGSDKVRDMLSDVDAMDQFDIAHEVKGLEKYLDHGDGEPESVDNVDDIPDEKEANETIETVDLEEVKLKKSKVKEVSEVIRVKLDSLNSLLDLAGELVLCRNELKESLSLDIQTHFNEWMNSNNFSERMELLQNKLISNVDAGMNSTDLKNMISLEMSSFMNQSQVIFETKINQIPRIHKNIQQVDLITNQLQGEIMNTRLQPVSVVFSKFPRVIRDIAKSLKKEIELVIQGETVELDKSILEALGDPLTHLMRNSADHGIELPKDREASGKNKKGMIHLSASHEGGQVLVEIKDDGKGIDPEKIKAIALEKGLHTAEELAALNDKQACELIFAPGFSTAEVISDVSGRGVGMDVVKTNIEKIGGSVEIDSIVGEGTRLLLKLPLTLSIVPCLLCRSDEKVFAVPQVNLKELVCLSQEEIPERILEVSEKPVLKLRDMFLPLLDLRSLLTSSHVDSYENCEELNVMVLTQGTHQFCLIVDEFMKSDDCVVKPLSRFVKVNKMYSGSTILGSGRVCMILDAKGVTEKAGLVFSADSDKTAEQIRFLNDKAESQSLLTFTNGTNEVFALNLSMIERVEKISPNQLSQLGENLFLKYESDSIRVTWMHDHMPIQHPQSMPDEIYVIVPKLVSSKIGILCHDIKGVIESEHSIDTTALSGVGIMGTSMIDDELIVFLNIYSLLESVDPEHYDFSDAQNFKGTQVLFAEDTPFFQHVVKDFLISMGCDVALASDGQEAWEILNSRSSFDLVVTDIVMPEMDGIALIKKIRNTAKFDQLPVVALTSLKNDRDQKRILGAGANFYEAKLDKESLRQTLTEALGALTHE